MHVNPSEVEVTLFASEDDLTNSLVPFYSSRGSGAAGSSEQRISIDEFQMKDPMTLFAVIAHELGHVILLRRELVDREEADMEPLNDLLTVFLGFGHFHGERSISIRTTSGRQIAGLVRASARVSF